ncbi:MAG: hypothetical protein WAS07_15815 [Micropruina sp.]
MPATDTQTESCRAIAAALGPTGPLDAPGSWPDVRVLGEPSGTNEWAKTGTALSKDPPGEENREG